jgi:hypothetical protein
MKPPVSQEIEQLMYLEERGQLEDLYGLSIRRAVLSGNALASDYQELNRRYASAARGEALGQSTPFRTPQLDERGICIGRDQGDRLVRRDLIGHVTHLALIGSTGSGKTSLLVPLLLQLFVMCGVMVIDLYKSEARRLVPLARRLGKRLAVLGPRDLRFNPLEPDGVDPALHLEVQLSMFARCTDLPQRSAMLLHQLAHEAYKEAGVFAGDLRSCPTYYDLYARVERSNALAIVKEALLFRIASLLAAMGPALAYRRAWRPSDLIDKLVVLEMGGASELVRQWLPSSILFSLFYGQVARGAVNASLRHITVLDDAQRFIAGDGLDTKGLTPFVELAGLLRSSGLAVAAGLQSLEPVPSSTLANMGGRFVGVLGSNGDLRRVASELSLRPDQTEWIATHLRPGRFLAQFNNAPWRHPFIIEVPRPQLPSVTEADIRWGREELDALPVIPAPEFQHWGRSSGSADPRSTQPQASTVHRPPSGGASGGHTLSERERRLLNAVIDHPLKPMSVYAKLASMKPADAKRARERLQALGLIRLRKVSLNARGRQPLVCEATPEGRAAAGR